MSVIKKKIVQFALAIVTFLVISNFGFLSSFCEKEIKRIKSPDGLVEAVLIETDCGATTSTSTSVQIVPNGGKIKGGKYSVFKADHIKDLSVSWRDPKFLEIKYRQARIFQFSNFWQSKYVDNFKYVVEIREIPLGKPYALSPDDRWVGY